MSADTQVLWSKLETLFVTKEDHIKTGRPNYSLISNGKKKDLELRQTDITTFWKTWCKEVAADKPGNLSVEVYQLPVEAMPVIVRIEALLSQDQIKSCVYKLQMYLASYFTFDTCSNNSNSCIVTQYVDPVKKTQSKSKKTAVQPEASTKCTTFWFNQCKLISKEFAEEHLNEMLNLVSVAVYGHVDGDEDTPKDSCVADQSIYQLIPLYGSNPEQFIVSYEGIMNVEVPDYTLAKMSVAGKDKLSPTTHAKVEHDVIKKRGLFAKSDDDDSEGEINSDSEGEFYDGPGEEDVTGVTWLPLILSIDYTDTLTLSIADANLKTKLRGKDYVFDFKKLLLGNLNGEVLDNTTNTSQHYEMFIDMWSVDRIIDMRYWRTIGAAYSTLEQGTSRGLLGWVNTIKRALKVSIKETFLSKCNLLKTCGPIYKTFTPGKQDSKAIATYAKLDSPLEYNDWHYKWVMEALNCGATASDSGVSDVVYRYLWLDVVTTSAGERTVAFRFHNNKLLKDHKLIYIGNIILRDIMQLYYDMKAALNLTIRDDPMMQLYAEKINKLLDATIAKLRMSPFRDSVARSCCCLFDCQDLNSYIDSDPDLTLLSDGKVTIVHGNEIYIRDSILQDYLVGHFDAKYDPTLSWDSEYVQKFLKWCKMLWNDEDLIDFNLKYVASLLRAGNSDKKILYLTGPSGNNMKTTWQKFINAMLGVRGVMAPPSFLTAENMTADAATPMAYSMKNARLVTIEEMGDKPMSSRIIKDVSGGQKRAIRKNYGDTENVATDYKIMVVANFPPPTDREGATEERIYIVPFDSEATYLAPKNLNEQFQTRKFERNAVFDREFPLMLDAGLWVVIHYWTKYSVETLKKPPKSVLDATSKYWDSVDPYNLFIKECTEKDEGECMDALTAYNTFSGWYQRSYKNKSVPSKDDFKKWMSVRLDIELNQDGEWMDVKLKRRRG